MKHNGLEIYDIFFDKEKHIGVARTSLVTLPAIESGFVYYGKENPQFKFTNEEKNELVGAIMIPDKLIFRRLGDESFYVNFTKETIKELTAYMIKNGTAGLFSIQHEVEVAGDDVEIQEIWIKDSENDKSVDFGIDEPIGTAFMKVKLNDPIIIKEVKENGLIGFSIELDASIKKKVDEFTEEKNEEINEKQEKKMTIKDMFKNEIEVGEKTLYFNDELKVSTLLVFDNDNVPSPYTGEFTLKDVKYTVNNGIITEAENVQVSIDEKFHRIEDTLTAVVESIERYTEQEKKLAEKKAEIELLEEQLNEEKQNFMNQKDKIKESGRYTEQIVSGLSDSNEWLKQFKK